MAINLNCIKIIIIILDIINKLTSDYITRLIILFGAASVTSGTDVSTTTVWQVG
jgi:hypothetical protein